jgi:rSAM/selenodomain-associated transferase 2
MTPAEVSVIIPALNEAERIDRAVRSARSAGAGEVIVSDGGSDDDTVAVARDAGASVIASPPGRGRQLRRGARHAGGGLLVFLHADNGLGENSLRAVCRLADHPADRGTLWGGFRQQIESPRVIYRWLELGNAARIRCRGMPFGDQAMFVSRSLYDRVGGFAALPLMEDVDLSRRLRRIRWPRLVDAKVHVDPRRWEDRGVVRQTIRNWGIQTAHCFGVGEQRLSTWYR